jgi:hypothetical protein
MLLPRVWSPQKLARLQRISVRRPAAPQLRVQRRWAVGVEGPTGGGVVCMKHHDDDDESSGWWLKWLKQRLGSAIMMITVSVQQGADGSTGANAGARACMGAP